LKLLEGDAADDPHDLENTGRRQHRLLHSLCPGEALRRSQNSLGFSASSGSFGSDYTYNIIDFEYFDTNPGTLRVELSLRCESDQFGTETVGPFILNATFEAPLP
jgi:hypothetical protein